MQEETYSGYSYQEQKPEISQSESYDELFNSSDLIVDNQSFFSSKQDPVIQQSPSFSQESSISSQEMKSNNNRWLSQDDEPIFTPKMNDSSQTPFQTFHDQQERTDNQETFVLQNPQDQIQVHTRVSKESKASKVKITAIILEIVNYAKRYKGDFVTIYKKLKSKHPTENFSQDFNSKFGMKYKTQESFNDAPSLKKVEFIDQLIQENEQQKVEINKKGKNLLENPLLQSDKKEIQDLFVQNCLKSRKILLQTQRRRFLKESTQNSNNYSQFYDTQGQEQFEELNKQFSKELKTLLNKSQRDLIFSKINRAYQSQN